MSTDPTPPASDEAEPTQQTTPAGQVGELDDMIDDAGADVGDDAGADDDDDDA